MGQKEDPLHKPLMNVALSWIQGNQCYPLMCYLNDVSVVRTTSPEDDMEASSCCSAQTEVGRCWFNSVFRGLLASLSYFIPSVAPDYQRGKMGQVMTYMFLCWIPQTPQYVVPFPVISFSELLCWQKSRIADLFLFCKIIQLAIHVKLFILNAFFFPGFRPFSAISDGDREILSSSLLLVCFFLGM